MEGLLLRSPEAWEFLLYSSLASVLAVLPEELSKAWASAQLSTVPSNLLTENPDLLHHPLLQLGSVPGRSLGVMTYDQAQLNTEARSWDSELSI